MTASPVQLTAASETEKFDVPLPAWLKNYLYQPEQLVGVSEGDRQLISEAFRFAHALHEGQTRKSGEPYIAHPIAVAGLLLDLGGNGAMIAAGFLHDVVEDTEVSPEEIEERFGAETRKLVEGVTKLTKFTFSSKTERQAENFRRMFLSMAEDIRVIVVKLADRLHNMRTLEHLRPDKQERIALETREIFAPLANRLGIWRFKWELEDLCFKYLEREAYRSMQKHISEKRTEREAKLEEAIEIIRDRLRHLGLHVWEIKGRPKHLYSIYHKMQRQHKEFDEIFDIAGIRIIVETNDECYRALAVIHDAFKPIPGRFKDYIGLPKPNRYQSLHTTVVGLNGRPLEVQIRTMEMHHIAEYGIAAHWKYKEAGHSAASFTSEDEKFTWLRQLIEWQSDLKDAEEYIDNLKDNLFEDDVYVFTPNGDVVALAKGATSIDFAYRIHTEVGNHMKGARINGRWSVLEKKLRNGDIVEIITQKNAHPSLDWLNYVVTPSAKNRIRQWFKRSRRDENLARGRSLLEKELGKTGLDSILKSEAMQTVAHKCNYQNTEDLLAALGYGEVTLNQVVNRWRDQVRDQEEEHLPQLELEASLNTATKPAKPLQDSHKYPIAGIEGLVYTIASCCAPLPGEPIIGIVTRSHKGISIHHRSCANVQNFDGDRLIPVSWNPSIDQKHAPVYPVDLRIEVIDRVGVLRDILSRLSDQHINVRSTNVKTSHGQPAIISLRIEIRNAQQLAHSINQIKNMSDTLNVRRVTQIEQE
ncbi:bifunctional (p)ppGpp synthetase/guanosine-3',5'-bis(diphosphate) 3'-pyrophosphohydrolase [Picosynechococcus sp. PCC 11901]|uniref:RelA/SpoT family protein n=1 Tax=Picosynechococcus sp. PCC 11901 TaxID=2579791 RepID=UPI0010FBFFF6|nr:bifunctional (p)ppGpp synthetase/guanosine-3',5'-bis(diphosphate) 3'-pyrophosphohydrolase [Picosynechococcus sp. PCC 11901]QCS48613.1 bifunctional (p)ppGpp synthetase/guanosine-3',5'-bis(diphosphate) 3'-pyrophosphohydrolase [Picosynechococcus sp. PCC 11901]